MNLMEEKGIRLGDAGSMLKKVMLKKVCASEHGFEGEVRSGCLPRRL